MEHPKVNWNDDRLDHLAGQVASLRRHVDERFEKQDTRIQERFDTQDTRIQERFDTLDAHLHGLKNTMIVTLAGILAAFGGAIAAIQF